MFQYGILECDEPDVLYNYPVNGLDTALKQYRKLVKEYPNKKFKLVRIEYKEMEVLPE